MFLFPELFPTKDQFQSATAHRDPVVWRSEMNDAFTWMMTNRDESTVAFATDARNTKIRMSFQTIVNETTKDEKKASRKLDHVKRPPVEKRYTLSNASSVWCFAKYGSGGRSASCSQGAYEYAPPP
jgi:hypothetical protein